MTREKPALPIFFIRERGERTEEGDRKEERRERGEGRGERREKWRIQKQKEKTTESRVGRREKQLKVLFSYFRIYN